LNEQEKRAEKIVAAISEGREQSKGWSLLKCLIQRQGVNMDAPVQNNIISLAGVFSATPPALLFNF
jgi:hypothetical protein